MCIRKIPINPFCRHVANSTGIITFCGRPLCGGLEQKLSIEATDEKPCYNCRDGIFKGPASPTAFIQILGEFRDAMSTDDWLKEELNMKRYNPDFQGWTSEETGRNGWEYYSFCHGGARVLAWGSEFERSAGLPRSSPVASTVKDGKGEAEIDHSDSTEHGDEEEEKESSGSARRTESGKA